MELTNKTVFITGSSRGIGWGIAKTFAQAGANVVLNGRKEIPADKIAEIEAFGVKCISICNCVNISAMTGLRRMDGTLYMSRS